MSPNENRLASPPSLAYSLMLLIALAANASAQPMRVSMAQFDRWMFQNIGGEDEIKAVAMLQEQIEAEVNRIDQKTPLTVEQKERLRLAGRGDIQRLINRVDGAREKFRELEESDKNGNEFIQSALGLAFGIQEELRKGIFHDNSLLKKVGRSMLSPEQLAEQEHQAVQQKRQATETSIRVWLAGFDRVVPMDEAQQEFVMQWMQEHVKPFTGESRYKNFVLEYHLSTIPEEKLREHFDESQYEAIKKRQQRLNVQRLIPVLKQEGLID